MPRENGPPAPIDRAAREIVRQFGGEPAARRFDDALEDYGTRRAIEEALLGIGAGLIYQQALRQARRQPAEPPGPPEPPLVERTELPDDVPYDGFLLHVDVPHDDLEVEAHEHRDDALWLHEAGQTTLAQLPIEIGEFEWHSEPGSSVSRIALLEPPPALPAGEEDG